MPLAATEFIRRVLLHVLPRGFHRMRYDGLLANRTRHQHRPGRTPPRGPRLSGSLSRPDRTVVARLSPVSRRADAARRRPGRRRASPRDSGFVMTAHRSTSPRASVTAASTRVRRRVRVASTPPARAALPHPPVAPPTHPWSPAGPRHLPTACLRRSNPHRRISLRFRPTLFCLPSRRWSVGLTPAPSRRGATQKRSAFATLPSGYARVSKADGSQSLDLQRDALQATCMTQKKPSPRPSVCTPRIGRPSPSDSCPTCAPGSIGATDSSARNRHDMQGEVLPGPHLRTVSPDLADRLLPVEDA